MVLSSWSGILYTCILTELISLIVIGFGEIKQMNSDERNGVGVQ